MRAVLLAFAIVCGYTQIASADEQMRTLAVAGTWMAAEHATSMLAPPDICIVMNVVSNVLIRSNGSEVEFRVIDDKWSLPAGVQGKIQVGVGQLSESFDISSNTDNLVSADIAESDVVKLFVAMDKASTMTVTAGNSRPISVSLAGSTKATNAFRTCAGIHSNAASPGSNPFQ